jgi:hypothetical protein
VTDYLAQLRRIAATQVHWRADVLSLRDRLPAPMLDDLCDLGPDGVDQVCALSEMADDELSRVVDLYARRT